MTRKYNLNSRTVTAPLAAFVMASILFVYARTSIQAAKRNAQKHREADGGQINWHNESLRRHGQLDAPVKQNTVGQLLGAVKEGRRETEMGKEKGGKEIEANANGSTGTSETDEERRVRKRRDV